MNDIRSNYPRHLDVNQDAEFRMRRLVQSFFLLFNTYVFIPFLVAGSLFLPDVRVIFMIFLIALFSGWGTIIYMGIIAFFMYVFYDACRLGIRGLGSSAFNQKFWLMGVFVLNVVGFGLLGYWVLQLAVYIRIRRMGLRLTPRHWPDDRRQILLNRWVQQNLPK